MIKKILLSLMCLAMLTACSNVATYTGEDEKADYTKVIEELKEMSLDEIKAYCSENEIPLRIIYEESDEVPAEELIRVDIYVDELDGTEVPMIVLSSGYKTLVVPNSLGIDRNSMDATAENLKSKYEAYDYTYEFEDGCEDDLSCIVVNQSLKDETIKEPTVITYTFGKDPSKFGYIDPTEYLGTDENSFVEALNELGFENLKNIGLVYSNLPKGTICYYLPDGIREYTDTIEYKVSLGPKPKPVQPTTPPASSGSNNETSNGSNTPTPSVPDNFGNQTVETPSNKIVVTQADIDEIYSLGNAGNYDDSRYGIRSKLKSLGFSGYEFNAEDSEATEGTLLSINISAGEYPSDYYVIAYLAKNLTVEIEW